MTTKTEIREVQPHARKGWQPPEAGRQAWKKFSPSASRESIALPMP